jgi:hypothetical protein
MKLQALSVFLCTTLLAGFAITALADVHVGIGIGVAPPVVAAPPVYYVPPPPVYYGPGIVIGVGGGHDWRDHRGRDDRWHDHGDHHR